MFMFQALKLLPAHVLFMEGEVFGIMAFAVAGIAWMLVPLWDIRKKPGSRMNLMMMIGVAAILFIIVLTVMGYII